MNNLKKQTVFVGLSGGVDSAVTAALLKEQGHEVVGVFIKTWHPDFLVCNEEEERLDAMRVAAFLDIPFLTFNFEDVYKKEVADYMISEYKKGRTPNPDVMCNKEVKFGAFLKKALTMGADFVATGHYAQTSRDVGCPTPEFRVSNTRQELLKGADPSKDQSYFLWTLKQEQLKHILFPVGNLKKIEVRKLAKKFKLPVADKKDSQGICFLGAVDLKEFLKHYIKIKRGKVINVGGSEYNRGKKGEVIGHHYGVVFYTLGERHGFTINQKGPNDGRYYVVDKDIKKNILYVSQASRDVGCWIPGIRVSNTRQSTSFYLALEKTNWISEQPKENKTYTAQIRYHGEFFPCTIICARQGLTQIVFEKIVRVASGQSIVVYDNDVCLGGGVVV